MIRNLDEVAFVIKHVNRQFVLESKLNLSNKLYQIIKDLFFYRIWGYFLAIEE